MEEQRPGSGETFRRVGLGAGLAIGMGVGVALGAGLHNMGTGIALGLVIGAAVMVLFTWAGTRMQREEQRRRVEAGGASPAEAVDHPGADGPGPDADPPGHGTDLPSRAATDEQPDQPSADSGGTGS